MIRLDEKKFFKASPCFRPWPIFLVTQLVMRDLFQAANLVVIVRHIRSFPIIENVCLVCCGRAGGYQPPTHSADRERPPDMEANYELSGHMMSDA